MTEEKIIELLQERGERVTEVRRKTVRVLAETKQPLGVAEILSKLKGGVNRTTVYRELWFLKKQGLLVEVSLQEGKKRFELRDDHCHHHLVCEECGEVEDVILEEKSLFKQVKKLSNFQLQRHSIEFFGLCNNCQ